MDPVMLLTAYAFDVLDRAGRAAQSTYVGKVLELLAVRRLLEQAHLRYPHHDVVARLADLMRQRAETPPRLPKDFTLEAVLATLPGADDLRRFLYELAECRIAAAGSSLFGTGQRVTPREARFLEELRLELGLK
jgi:hypothetical protein